MTSVARVWNGFSEWRESRNRLGVEKRVHFVPTMGALHEGHAALIRSARMKAGQDDEVVVSVYVNPTQFNDPLDFEAYPKTEDADVTLALGAGADALVFPDVEEMYPGGVPDSVGPADFGPLTRLWEAEHRPGHFDGVVAVVRALFREALPSCAYFGEKDWQQLCVIRSLAGREFPNLEIVPVGTIREEGGLAMSSRNARLSASGRKRAESIHRGLDEIVRESGGAAVVDAVRSQWEREGMEVEYVAVVDARELTEPWTGQRPGRAIAAVWIEGVRLIDNMPLAPRN